MSTLAEVAVPPRPRKRRHSDAAPAFAYWVVSPALVIVAAVAGLPLLYSLYLSFIQTNPITKRWVFVGLGNYADLIESPEFWAAFGRTAYFAGFAVIGTTVLGMLMALVLNERFRGRGLFRSIVLIPWAMAPVAIAVLWSFIFAGNFGILNGLLHDLGLGSLASAWLGDGFRALNLVALTHVWNQAPLTALILLAGLQAIPGNLHKAAILDGAGPIRRFFSITLPWLKPSLLFITIIATINALMAFDILLIMTGGGPGSATTLLSWLGYSQSFQLLRFGEGAAVLYVLTIASLLLAVLYFFVLGPTRSKAHAGPAQSISVEDDIGRVTRTNRRFEMASLPPFKPRRLLDPKWVERLTQSAFNLGLVIIFLWSALPVLALLMISLSPPADLIRVPPSLFPSAFTIDNYITVLAAEGKTGPQAQRVPLSITNSFVVGVSVAVINVFLGTLAGYAFARYTRKRFFGFTLWGLLLTRMIPALTLVLPFFIIFRVLGLLDTRLALIIAYSSILLPLCSWMMKTSFESVPISLERAALIDGCTRTGMLLKILMPAVRPGIIAALIFAFLVSWNEFLFALILTSTPSAQTIPVVIAGFLSQAQFYEYGPLFAASVLAILPPVLVAFFFQRYLVQGVLSGAVKG